MFEKVNQPLKCHSNFLGHIHTNVPMDTNTDHITPAHAYVCRVIKLFKLSVYIGIQKCGVLSTGFINECLVSFRSVNALML